MSNNNILIIHKKSNIIAGSGIIKKNHIDTRNSIIIKANVFMFFLLRVLSIVSIFNFLVLNKDKILFLSPRIEIPIFSKSVSFKLIAASIVNILFF